MNNRIKINIPIPFVGYYFKYERTNYTKMLPLEFMIITAILEAKNNKQNFKSVKETIHKFLNWNQNFDNFAESILKRLLVSQTISLKNETYGSKILNLTIAEIDIHPYIENFYKKKQFYCFKKDKELINKSFYRPILKDYYLEENSNNKFIQINLPFNKKDFDNIDFDYKTIELQYKNYIYKIEHQKYPSCDLLNLELIKNEFCFSKNIESNFVLNIDNKNSKIEVLPEDDNSTILLKVVKQNELNNEKYNMLVENAIKKYLDINHFVSEKCNYFISNGDFKVTKNKEDISIEKIDKSKFINYYDNESKLFIFEGDIYEVYLKEYNISLNDNVINKLYLPVLIKSNKLLDDLNANLYSRLYSDNLDIFLAKRKDVKDSIIKTFLEKDFSIEKFNYLYRDNKAIVWKQLNEKHLLNLKNISDNDLLNFIKNNQRYFHNDNLVKLLQNLNDKINQKNKTKEGKK